MVPSGAPSGYGRQPFKARPIRRRPCVNRVGTLVRTDAGDHDGDGLMAVSEQIDGRKGSAHRC